MVLTRFLETRVGLLRRTGTLAAVALAAAWAHGGASMAGEAKRPLPPLAEVRKAVAAYFESLPGYQPGALIVQSEVRGAIARLDRLGFRVPDAEEIVRQTPADGEPLVQMLRAPAGSELAVRVAGLPHGYDRLDRLLKLPRGAKIVQALVRGPDGDKLIEYMTTAPGGAGLGRQLSRSPGGADFNEPTGRIYTVDALLERIEESYRAAAR